MNVAYKAIKALNSTLKAPKNSQFQLISVAYKAIKALNSTLKAPKNRQFLLISQASNETRVRPFGPDAYPVGLKL